MKNSNDKVYQAGIGYTSDSFLMDTYLIFRKTRTEYVYTQYGLIQKTSSSFHAYDLSTSLCRIITSSDFYELLSLYNDTGGLTKKDEEYLYDNVIDNNFVMYCLLTSRYM